MATTRIQSGGVTALSITHDKLHTDMNLSTKTVVLPSLSALTVTNTMTAGSIAIPDQGLTLNQAFGSGVPTLHFKGTSDNGRAGALYFQESDGAGGHANAAAIYATDGSNNNSLYGGLTIAAYQSDIRFATSTLAGTKAIIKSDGKVGIGTDAPPSLLSVRKTVTTFEDVISIIGQNSPTDIMGALSYDQTADTMIIRNDQAYATGGIAFRAGGTNNHLFIQSGGNVGIGTDSPKRPLQIGATGSFPISFNGNYPDIHMNTYYESGWRIHTAGFGAKTTFNGATGAFGFSNVASSQVANANFTPLERLTILANGNVGIGTDNPQETLDVDGNIVSRLGARNYLVSKQIPNAVGSGNATKYILIRKTTTAGSSKFIGRISGTRTEGVSANNHAILDVGFDINSNNQYPKFYLDYLSGYNASNYGHMTARFVNLDWDDGNGSATWYAIELSGTASANWPADLDYMSFQGYQINIDLQVISDDTTSYNAISNIVSMGRGGMKSIMHSNVGIGTSDPVAKLHVWNEQGGDATDKATMLSEAVMKIQPHATNSTNMLISQVNNGDSMGIQVTNGSATANWDIALSPFGGHVGIGVVDPTRRLSVVGPSGTDVVQSIRNPNTTWSQYALTRYGTEGEDVRYMDFGYYRGATEAGRGLVIKNQAGNNIVYFLDSGKVGIKTDPIGSFSLVGTSTIYNGYQDPDLTVVNGNGHSNATSGEISMVHTFQGTGANNDLFEFQYDATSWKSFGFEIDISTATGWGKVVGGGYNNGGVSGSYSISGSKITAFAFDNVTGNNQAHILRCTFGGGVHHTVRVKYWQGGGDGGPRADRATMRFIS